MSQQKPFTVQALSHGAVTDLRGLMHVFADAFRDTKTYQSAPPPDAYLASLLAKPDFIAIVARDGEQIVGGLTAYVLQKPEQERSEIYIYDLAVAETHRRRGIARSLVAELQSVAAVCDAWVIYVQADLEDTPAINLYTSLGTREDVLHFDIDVPKADD
jgi:aminoglycoside 3-N-acetyltransferase I